MVEMTIESGEGQIKVQSFTPGEQAIFDREYNILTRLWANNFKSQDGAALFDTYFNSKGVRDAVLTAAQACKAQLQPSSGPFEGVNATSGYGWRPIRADTLVPTAQGRTFEATLSGTAHNYYGLFHNGTVGAAYNATPLYLRKEVGVIICGFIELTGNPLVEAVQFELNTRPLSIHTLNFHMLGGDKPVYFLPTPYFLKPAGRYRSQFQQAATSGSIHFYPIGFEFPTAEFMLSTAPTEPATTAP